jgi:hypothetical protein
MTFRALALPTTARGSCNSLQRFAESTSHFALAGHPKVALFVKAHGPKEVTMTWAGAPHRVSKRSPSKGRTKPGPPVDGKGQALTRKTSASFSIPVTERALRGDSPGQGKGTIGRPEVRIGYSG